MNFGKVLFVILLFFLFVSLVEANDQKPYAWRVMKVVDANTFLVDARPEFALPVKVQVKGIESPASGKWARCNAERNLAAESANVLKNQKKVTFISIDWSEKRPGTIEADVYAENVSVASSLVNRGLAVRNGYNRDWCE